MSLKKVDCHLADLYWMKKYLCVDQVGEILNGKRVEIPVKVRRPSPDTARVAGRSEIPRARKCTKN